jgi:hypothetical protein
VLADLPSEFISTTPTETSPSLLAAAIVHQSNVHFRRKVSGSTCARVYSREYIGVEAQFDGVNAQQCESQAAQQRGGQLYLRLAALSSIYITSSTISVNLLRRPEIFQRYPRALKRRNSRMIVLDNPPQGANLRKFANLPHI